MFDYGTKERNDAEIARLKAEGQDAFLRGGSAFGAGGFKPGDMVRAHYWLQGYREAQQLSKDNVESSAQLTARCW